MAVRKYLDASTAYITQQDSEKLTVLAEAGGVPPLRVIDHEYGFWVLEMDTPENDLVAERARLELSEAFWKLMDKADQLGCIWVNIDRDGDDDIDLPKHQW